MQDKVKKIKDEVREVSRDRDKAVPVETTDSMGNECLEWQTALVLEVKGAPAEEDEEGEKGDPLYRQTIPVQFDISFDLEKRKIYMFMQWGRIDGAVWARSASTIQDQFKESPDVQVRFSKDREVVELGVIYPIVEFDFGYVYEEMASYFGMVNSIFFKKANKG